MQKPASINGRLISVDLIGALTLSGEAGDKLPDRIKLFKWGRNETIKGPIVIGPNTLKCFSANQKKLGFEEIAFDYNHQTVPSSPTYKEDPVEVAAYGAPEVIDGDGLYVKMNRWTPSGNKNAPNYQDLSPTPQLDKNGEVIFLHSVALVRQGCTEGLHLFSANFLQSDQLLPLSSMNYQTALVQLLVLLGVELPQNPTEAQIVDGVTAATKKVKAPEGNSQLATLSPELDARLKKVEQADEARERRVLITLAATQGKVIPLGEADLASLPLTTLTAMIEKLPVTVPVASRGASPAPVKTGVTTLSPTQKEICQKLGVTEESYLKTLAADAPVEMVTV